MPSENNSLSINELDWYKSALYRLIKPCPFCCSVDISILPTNNDGNEQISCLSCGAKITRAINCGVVNAWNKRTPTE